jgi:3-hydroxyisobutyrate dehydrogenase
MQVGFIGIGTMGGGMALNLRRAGYALMVHDLRRDLAAAHEAAGATWAASVGEIGRACDVVFTSLPGPKDAEAVALAEDGLLATLRPGAAWFDLTTNSPALLRRLGPMFAQKGVQFLDAPVSGGPAGARSGKLALYVGGDRETFERHKPLLDAIGDQTMYVGPLAAGTIAKLSHNCASFGIRMVIAEVFSLGVKAGVEPLALWHAMRQGATGRRRTFDGVGEQFLQNRYEPAAFALRLAHKDLMLALDLAHECGVPMPMAEQAMHDFTAALERGWGEQDSRSPMRLQLERAGVEIEESAEAVRGTLEEGGQARA